MSIDKKIAKWVYGISFNGNVLDEGNEGNEGNEWNVLMDAVEKIESMGCFITICKNTCQVERSKDVPGRMIHEKASIKIEAVHEAVYQFITQLAKSDKA